MLVVPNTMTTQSGGLSAISGCDFQFVVSEAATAYLGPRPGLAAG